MTSGWQGTTYFRRFSLDLVSKPAILLKKSWVGHRKTTPDVFDYTTADRDPTILQILLSTHTSLRQLQICYNESS